MIFEFQVIFLARLFINGIVIFGVIVSNPIVMIIVFKNYTTLCNHVQSTNLSNNWTIANVWMKHFENFHDMLINNALCCKGAIALWPFWSWGVYTHIFPMWLVDATNAMSSPFGHNGTFVSGMSQACKRALATMPSYFLFITQPNFLHCTPYQ
jgi:hypothetical protein